MSEDPPICPKCDKTPIPGCRQGSIGLAERRCPIHMGTPTEEICEQCHGSGWLLENKRMCPNFFSKQIKRHLGPELAKVKGVLTSPLYDRKAGVDLTGKNIRIQGCPWRNLLPHLRWALTCKGLTFSHRVYDDERIKNVFVGAEDFRARPASIRHSIPTFNSVDDLMSTSFDLVIIKLGYLGYKNQAAAGALKEALLFREKNDKPTWIVEEPNRDWTHSCDGDVAFYIDDNFNTISIKPTADPGTEALHDHHNDIGFDDDDVLDEPAAFTQEAPTHETTDGAIDFGDDEEEEEIDYSGGSGIDDMMNDPVMGDPTKKKGRY